MRAVACIASSEVRSKRVEEEEESSCNLIECGQVFAVAKALIDGIKTSLVVDVSSQLIRLMNNIEARHEDYDCRKTDLNRSSVSLKYKRVSIKKRESSVLLVNKPQGSLASHLDWMPTICIDENVYTVDEKIMACGQECSAKTYTMMGDDTVEGHGMVSYLEIYQERIRDLLVPFKVDPQAVRAEWQSCLDSGASRCGSVKSDRNWLESSDDTASYLSFGAGTLKSWKDKRAPSVCFDNPSTKEYLKLREHPVSGPYVKGLSWKDGYTWEDMEQIRLEGAARRTLGATPTNKCSDRGHTLFTMRIVKAWFMTPVSQRNCTNEYRESLISNFNVTVDYTHLKICQFRFSDRNSEFLTKLVEISNKFVVVQVSRYKEQRGRSPHVSFANLVDLAATIVIQ
ncbi:hypothetical protein MPTK1_5g18430 [Marchantia polymorpha subsp. ruderalis]